MEQTLLAVVHAALQWLAVLGSQSKSAIPLVKLCERGRREGGREEIEEGGREGREKERRREGEREEKGRR